MSQTRYDNINEYGCVLIPSGLRGEKVVKHSDDFSIDPSHEADRATEVYKGGARATMQGDLRHADSLILVVPFHTPTR